MSATKADMVLAQLDRIKSTCDEAMSRLGMSPRPILQFFGPPVPPQLALFNAAYDRSKLQKLLENVPEPPEGTPDSRGAFHRSNSASDTAATPRSKKAIGSGRLPRVKQGRKVS